MFKNFLITCAEMLNREDILNELYKFDTVENVQSNQNDILRLIHYYNHTAAAVFEHYIELITSETVSSNNLSEIEYCKLSYEPIKIIEVTDEIGHELKFTTTPFFIKILHPNKLCKVTYHFTPAEIKDFSDPITIPKKVQRAIAYAVVSEFLASKELFKESVFWKDKFTNELFKLKQKKERRLKSTF